MAKETKGKDTSNRASPTKTKDQQKHEVQGRIQKTSSKIAAQRKDVDAKKQKLEGFSKTGIDGVVPEKKDEYRNVQEEFLKLDRTLKDYETELQEFQAAQEHVRTPTQ
jgi:hypothetical protein